MKVNVQVKKIADLDRVAPGFSNVWRAIKKETGTRVRCPRSVTLTDEPMAMCADDRSCAARFSLDIATMKLGARVHVSCGDWASFNRGQEKGVVDIPMNQAVVSCEWNDFYRFFSMTVEVAEGTLPKQMEA